MKTIELNNIHIIGSELFPDRAYNWREKTQWYNITYDIPTSEIEKLGNFIQCEVPVEAKPNYHTFDLILKKFYRGK